MLADRIKRVIGKVIGEVQNAFIKGRFILDGVLVANEVVDYVKRNRGKGMLLKIDFEKAYDSVNWDYIQEVMLQMGFGQKWCKWIDVCLQTSSISVLVNGSPTEEFKMSRGIRQGDPLSPFLFLIAAEGINVVVNEAINNDVLKGITVERDRVVVSHLQYADDTIFFCDWSRNNGRNLMWLLKCFEKASGLRINLSKSKLYGVGVSEVEVEEMAHMLKCRPGKLPFMYLGLPIGVNMNKAGSWGIIVEKFKDTLSEWKAKSISFGGRLTLVQSVLGSLSLYYFSLFRAPTSVINTLERVRKNFFWGGGKDTRKMAWIKWDKVLSKFELGGLNVGSLKASNLGLLGKWWWRFREDGEALWVRVIKSLYGESGGLYETCERVRVRILGTWGNIVRVGREIDRTGVVFSSSFGRKLGNGDGIRFWKDKWAGDFKLCERFPRLFRFEGDEDVSVRNHGEWGSDGWRWKWEWVGVPRGRSLGELEELSSVLRDLAPVLGYVDSSRWFLASDEVFSVKHIRELIDEKILRVVTYVEETSWCKFVPRKVNVFIWRLKCGRIPVRSILDHIGIDLDSTLCPCCENAVETIDHIMVRCPLVSVVWSKIFLWWGIGCFNGSSLSDILSSHGLVSSKLESVWQAVIRSSLYLIWKARNSKIFKSKEMVVADIYFEIQLISFFWISHRFKKLGICCVDWCKGSCFS
ncbi:putative RNA-directed DNA polymerase [Tanacetum coccineum]